jgi:hypothetical protein
VRDSEMGVMIHGFRRNRASVEISLSVSSVRCLGLDRIKCHRSVHHLLMNDA